VGKLSDSLKDVVKKLAYNTSVDQLKKKGYDKVNVLGLDRITSLIQEAVQRTLRTRLLANATKEEFMRLLKSNEHLSQQHDELRRLKDAAEEQVDDLRRELSEQERLLESKLDRAVSEAADQYSGEDEEIAEHISVLMGELASEGAGDSSTRDRVLELVMAVVRSQRRQALAAREELADREVHTMQRRITKLQAALQETETRLTNVTAVRSIDDGISSVYKEVQGLNASDEAFSDKQFLMENIFAANVRLQKKA
jgi:hypothetical protein